MGKTLYFHNASLHPELKIGTSKFLVKSGEMPGGGGGNLRKDWQSGRRRGMKLLVTT